eukprot:scaffold2.g6958.t1
MSDHANQPNSTALDHSAHADDHEPERCTICYSTAAGPAGMADSLARAPCGAAGCGSVHVSCFFRWQLRRADLRQDPHTCAVCLGDVRLPDGTVAALVAEGALDAGQWARLERLRSTRMGPQAAQEEADDPLERLIRLEIEEELEAAAALAAADDADAAAAAEWEAPAAAAAAAAGARGQAGEREQRAARAHTGERPWPRRRGWRGPARAAVGVLVALAAVAAAVAAAAVGALWRGGGSSTLLRALAEDPWADEFAFFST